MEAVKSPSFILYSRTHWKRPKRAQLLGLHLFADMHERAAFPSFILST